VQLGISTILMFLGEGEVFFAY